MSDRAGHAVEASAISGVAQEIVNGSPQMDGQSVPHLDVHWID